MLEKFDEMTLKDAKRAFIIYLNFIKINKEIRKMASSIIQEFNISLGISFYDIDTKVIEALKISIELKEKEKGATKAGVQLITSDLDSQNLGKPIQTSGISSKSNLKSEQSSSESDFVNPSAI